MAKNKKKKPTERQELIINALVDFTIGLVLLIIEKIID